MDFLRYALEIEDEVIGWRRRIHQNPELGNMEYKTAEFVERTLRSIGIENIRRIGETGVLGILEGHGAGRVAAVRADMDALPSDEKSDYPYPSQCAGVAHTCGHDIHTAILLGVAKSLHKCRDELRGTVKFFFQPAEEILGGAVSMIEGGALENPDVDCILALHVWPELPSGVIGVRYGQMMAATDHVLIEITGSQGHAAHPHKCVDPITIAGQLITNVQAIVSREVSPVDSAVLSFGKISGGTAHNIIPQKVTLEGTIRTISPRTREQMSEAIERFSLGVARNMRGDARVVVTRGTPPLICDESLCEQLEKSAVDLLGAEKVIRLQTPSMGGEDFSFYLEKVPGVFYRLGCASEGKKSVPLHSPEFYPDEGAFKTGVAVTSRFVADLLK
ncbi:MAG: amidohydrolase [Synergistaceae bacterium]|nr:amidohydrolase [Synergistaceae bacterium]